VLYIQIGLNSLEFTSVFLCSYDKSYGHPTLKYVTTSQQFLFFKENIEGWGKREGVGGGGGGGGKWGKMAQTMYAHVNK
jgi:hypothetical protein